ncbi:hypothetical protein [Desulfonauticus submarinus]
MVIVVKDCNKCPFCTKLDDNKKLCNITFPPYREIKGNNLPSWCPLKKEQVIVRNFE